MIYLYKFLNLLQPPLHAPPSHAPPPTFSTPTCSNPPPRSTCSPSSVGAHPGPPRRPPGRETRAGPDFQTYCQGLLRLLGL